MIEHRPPHGPSDDERIVHGLEHYRGFRFQLESRYDDSWRGAIGSVDVFEDGTRSFRIEVLVSEEYALVHHGRGPAGVAASLALHRARKMIDEGKFTPGEVYRDVWT